MKPCVLTKPGMIRSMRSRCVLSAISNFRKNQKET